jgi:hypothetical protein
MSCRTCPVSCQWVPEPLSWGVTVASADVQNAQSSASTPPYVFMAWYLIKHRKNFASAFTCTFTFIFKESTCPVPSTKDGMHSYCLSVVWLVHTNADTRHLPTRLHCVITTRPQDKSSPSWKPQILYILFHCLWITKKMINEDFSLLGCDAVLLGEWLLMFWRILCGSLDPWNDSHTFLWNIRNNPPNNAASHPRRLEFPFTLLWKPHNLQIITVHFEMKLLGV